MVGLVNLESFCGTPEKLVLERLSERKLEDIQLDTLVIFIVFSRFASELDMTVLRGVTVVYKIKRRGSRTDP